ncbi:MAG: hypothetical protein IPH77_16890 [Ignavibacteria bacterium]|nr:hypothetical protein [Ignavibacteria bacterium]MBK7160156.1 hypothetical protein [Ignavibacteria bacterium]
MKNLSLKIDDNTFQDTEKIISKINKNRNRYINEAVEFYNLLHKRKILSKQFKKESILVRDESMKVLKEFEGLLDDNKSI